MDSPIYQPSFKHRIAIVLALLMVALMSTGCVSRRLIVRTEPEGAFVTVDGYPQGYSPVAVPYVYGGSRDIQIEKDGFETEKLKQDLSDPWFLRPPVSFLTENFSPVEIRHQPVVDVQLRPKKQVNSQVLIQRANTLRDNVQRGTVTAPVR